MGESKAERQKYADREATRRAIERKQREMDARTDGGGGYDSLAARACGYDSLWAYLASREFRSLVLRPDLGDGGSFTLKGVLVVREVPRGVYMHGALKHVDMLPETLDRLLLKADWREDRYWNP